MSLVTKDVFLNAQVCMTLGWFLRQHGAVAAPSEADQFRMEQGNEIGKAARRLFPEGIYAPPSEADDATALTKKLLVDPKVTIIFEATFATDLYIAKPDILKRGRMGWEVIEVKSNLEDTVRMDELVDDLAYTVMVLNRCGLKVARASLMLISRAYRKGMAASSLLVNVDQTESVKARLKDFQPLWKPVHEGTISEMRPKPTLIPACKKCDYFSCDCIGAGVKDPVFSIPSLHKTRLAQLSAKGVLEIMNLPADFPLTDSQQRMVDCVRTKKPFVSTALRRELLEVQWPVHYLDFESVMTAIPLFAEVSPFEQIVTQYSLHCCSAPGKVIDHREYLADCDRDCQRELAEQLLNDLGTDGSIVVYSSFEGTRIGALAKQFPDLARRLHAVKARLFDLLKVIRRGFYHHDFGGSFSIKNALPVLVPEMSYEKLGIGDGDTAVARFAKMAMSRYTDQQAKRVRADLLEYCKQDTLAMVRLHERLLAQCPLR